jgi:hypothetical protein
MWTLCNVFGKALNYSTDWNTDSLNSIFLLFWLFLISYSFITHVRWIMYVTVFYYTLCTGPIIIIGSTALGGPWPSQANVASDFSPVQPSNNFYSPTSLCLPPPRQSILFAICHVLVDLQDFCVISFLGNSFSSIRATWLAHLNLRNCYYVNCIWFMHGTYR